MADPLHWFTVTDNAEVIVDVLSTVHCTRWVPPPPFNEPLHWVTVAFVVVWVGLHASGRAPPPAPEPSHWFTVAGVGVNVPVMLLVMMAEQVTVLPGAFTELLHWFTDVTTGPPLVVDVVHVSCAPAAP